MDDPVLEGEGKADQVKGNLKQAAETGSRTPTRSSRCYWNLGQAMLQVVLTTGEV